MAEITVDEVRQFLVHLEGHKVTLNEIRSEFNILQGAKSYSSIRVIMHRLAEQRIVKSLGARGEYKVLQEIKPINWWEDVDETPLEFNFPRSHEDDSYFGIEDIAEVFPGDMILIDGVSNYGKTAVALNVMAENLGLFENVYLMGSEYTAANGKISPKFKRRMNRMEWVQWINDGHPKFQLYPVGSDYEDYIQADSLNVVDWISLAGDYYMIDRVMKAIKDRVGTGIAVVVLQKNRASEFGEGGERIERYTDVRLIIDPYGNESMLTLGKVKAPKGKATGRKWAFSIVDYGANLSNIREVVGCPKCYCKGYIKNGMNTVKCILCGGLKYIDKHNDIF